jgi:NCS1 family nucleobase:cation symporter-1
MGALCVVLAGWTTANPTLYRAGLALQVATPGWPRWLVTLVAGVVTTIVACSPFVFLRLLGFVALYGILLFPVGAIVIAEHWIFPRLGLTQFWSTRKGQLVNWPALVSWMAGVGLAAGAWIAKDYYGHEVIHEFFLAIPVWIVTTVLYIGLAAIAGARDRLPETFPETTAMPALPAAPAENTFAAPLTGIENALYYASGLAAIGLLGWWVIGDLAGTLFVAEDDLAAQASRLPRALGPLQLGFFLCAAIWFHFREKSMAWDWTLALGTSVVGVASLVLCLGYSVSVFLGFTTPEAFRVHLMVLTIVYFISSVVWLRQWEKRPGRG